MLALINRASFRPQIWLLVIVGVAFTAAPGRAGFLPITNAGFENPPLVEGTFTLTVPGWTIGSGVGAPSVGVFDPSAIHYVLGAVPEGENVLFINNVRDVSQTLSAVLTADTHYELRVQIGNRRDLSFAGYAIELFAGTNLLAADINTVSVPNDSFRLATVTYDATSADPFLGQSLTIRLRTVTAGQTNFDDVKLSAESLSTPNPVPAPGGLLLGVMGAAALGLARLRPLLGSDRAKG
jgi:hypothetical protein